MNSNNSLMRPFQTHMMTEWRKHRYATLVPLWTVLLLTFLFPLFSSVLSVSVTFSILGILIGSRLAIADVMEGTEEFAISLPPTRTHRYLAGALLAMSVPLCAWVAVELLTVNAAPRLWSLWVESGYSQPYELGATVRTRYLGFTVPLLTASLSYALGRQARTPQTAFLSAVIALILSVGTVTACFHIESQRAYAGVGHTRLNPESPGMLLLTVSALTAIPLLMAGLRPYQRKEVTGATQMPSFALAITIALLIIFSLYAFGRVLF